MAKADKADLALINWMTGFVPRCTIGRRGRVPTFDNNPVNTGHITLEASDIANFNADGTYNVPIRFKVAELNGKDVPSFGVKSFYYMGKKRHVMTLNNLSIGGFQTKSFYHVLTLRPSGGQIHTTVNKDKKVQEGGPMSSKNNTVYDSINVSKLDRADLVVTRIARLNTVPVPGSKQAKPTKAVYEVGKSYPFTFIVKNVGSRVAKRFKVKWRLNDKAYVHGRIVSALAPGETKAFRRVFRLPKGGKNTLTGIADSSGVVAERFENNNQRKMSITVMVRGYVVATPVKVKPTPSSTHRTVHESRKLLIRR